MTDKPQVPELKPGLEEALQVITAVRTVRRSSGTLEGDAFIRAIEAAIRRTDKGESTPEPTLGLDRMIAVATDPSTPEHLQLDPATAIRVIEKLREQLADAKKPTPEPREPTAREIIELCARIAHWKSGAAKDRIMYGPEDGDETWADDWNRIIASELRRGT